MTNEEAAARAAYEAFTRAFGETRWDSRGEQIGIGPWEKLPKTARAAWIAAAAAARGVAG